MPHRFPFASHGNEEDAVQQQQEVDGEVPHKRIRRPSMLRNLRFGALLKRHHEQQLQQQQDVGWELSPPSAPTEHADLPTYFIPSRSPSLPNNVANRRPLPSLPRQQTFSRQESERRENLLVVPPSPMQRRTVSANGRRGAAVAAARRPSLPKPFPIPSVSAPEVVHQQGGVPSEHGEPPPLPNNTSWPLKHVPELPPLQIPDQGDGEIENELDDEDDKVDRDTLQEEYERRWILNLSMHFRDKSNREKFFVTFAETPTKWRRLTVSLDYRNVPEGSLEADLSTLRFQRDKSFRIYEAIRESLPDIQFCDTVTNLKLETTATDGQLHIHVREDANETIHYPSISLFDHIQVRRYRETELEFLSHLSGFVYKVKAGGTLVIKKEIPGPDTIDEFLYEVNALDSLLGCGNVIQLEGLVTDAADAIVKGLLISFADQGALVDMIYDSRDSSQLPWHRREKWAKQIVRGLSDIHEAGYVQGDFTLSNIVIDADDRARIIDINRRGCPVGWEPPELNRLIDSGQRISMCIGVKTDLFQLGMVLWALAKVEDEPEHEERPLPPLDDSVPAYFRRMVEVCLSPRPQDRKAAQVLLSRFPPTTGYPLHLSRPSVDFADSERLRDYRDRSLSPHRSDKEYIDPDMAVTLADVSAGHRYHPYYRSPNQSPNGARPRRRDTDASHFTSGQVTYVDPADFPDSNAASTTYRFDSSGSWIVGHPRAQSPFGSSPPTRGGTRRGRRPYAGGDSASSSATSLSQRCEPPSRSRQRCGSEYSDTGKEELRRQAGVLRVPVEEREYAPLVEEIVTGERRSESVPREARALRDKRLVGVQGHDFAASYSPLLHTDSGFDEPAVEEIESATPVDISALSRSTSLPNVGHRERDGDLEARTAWSELGPSAALPSAVESGKREQPVPSVDRVALLHDRAKAAEAVPSTLQGSVSHLDLNLALESDDSTPQQTSAVDLMGEDSKRVRRKDSFPARGEQDTGGGPRRRCREAHSSETR